MSNKILVSDSKFLECVDEIATQITEMNFCLLYTSDAADE